MRALADMSLSGRRPEQTRSITDPSPVLLSRAWSKGKDTRDRPGSSGGSSTASSRSGHSRNRSPFSRSHLRTRSTSGSSLAAPPMTRAHSMPNPNTPRQLDSFAPTPISGSLSPSPLRSSARAGSPFKFEDGGFNTSSRSPSWLDMSSDSAWTNGIGIAAIQEDSELDLTPRPVLQHPHSSSAFASFSFSRSSSQRGSRRPASPLHSFSNAPPTTDHHQPTFQLSHTPRSGSSSPTLNPQRYNEAYPQSLHHYASTSSFSSFSMPSTPTSMRSRSPSISSLETIEDAPEMESVAEAEVMERLKLVIESESDGENDAGNGGVRRRSLDVGRGGRRTGLGLGLSGEKKRWSICGGERRGDLDLETIWED